MKIYILTESNIQDDDGDWNHEILGAFESMEEGLAHKPRFELDPYRERSFVIFDTKDSEFCETAPWRDIH